MAWPTPRWPIGWCKYADGATDPFGNPVETWADPVEKLVYAVAPASAGRVGSETANAGRDAVFTNMYIYLPDAGFAGPHDRYIIDGVLWEQDGEIGDYSKSPFDWFPGSVLTVRRVEG